MHGAGVTVAGSDVSVIERSRLVSTRQVDHTLLPGGLLAQRTRPLKLQDSALLLPPGDKEVVSQSAHLASGDHR